VAVSAEIPLAPWDLEQETRVPGSAAADLGTRRRSVTGRCHFFFLTASWSECRSWRPFPRASHGIWSRDFTATRSAREIRPREMAQLITLVARSDRHQIRAICTVSLGERSIVAPQFGAQADNVAVSTPADISSRRPESLA